MIEKLKLSGCQDGNNAISLLQEKAMTQNVSRQTVDPKRDAAIVTKAVLRAAEALNISQTDLAVILGVSKSTVSRMKDGKALLDPSAKEFEAALHFIRLFRSLDGITDGDRKYAIYWLNQQNRFLQDTPVHAIRTMRGLIATVDHLGSFRARV